MSLTEFVGTQTVRDRIDEAFPYERASSMRICFVANPSKPSPRPACTGRSGTGSNFTFPTVNYQSEWLNGMLN